MVSAHGAPSRKLRTNSARVAMSQACPEGQPHTKPVTFAICGVQVRPATFAATNPVFQTVEPLSPGGSGNPFRR